MRARTEGEARTWNASQRNDWFRAARITASGRQRHRVTAIGNYAIRPAVMLPTKYGQSDQALVDASKASGAM